MAKEPERQYRDSDGGRGGDQGKVYKEDRTPRPEPKEDRGNKRGN